MAQPSRLPGCGFPLFVNNWAAPSFNLGFIFPVYIPGFVMLFAADAKKNPPSPNQPLKGVPPHPSKMWI